MSLHYRERLWLRNKGSGQMNRSLAQPPHNPPGLLHTLPQGPHHVSNLENGPN